MKIIIDPLLLWIYRPGDSTYQVNFIRAPNFMKTYEAQGYKDFKGTQNPQGVRDYGDLEAGPHGFWPVNFRGPLNFSCTHL